jgi:hypothetical protein
VTRSIHPAEGGSLLLLVPRHALPAGIYDVMVVTILGFPMRVMDPLPDRRSALVGWLLHGTARMDGCLLALSAAVAPYTALMTYVGC